jgi:hypothetical protein
MKQRLALKIIQKVFALEHKSFLRRAEFEKKHNLTRKKFLSIFNLYCVLSYITIMKRIHKGYAEPLGETPGVSYTKLPQIKHTGVDFQTLEDDSFPQLKMENTLLVQKLF